MVHGMCCHGSGLKVSLLVLWEQLCYFVLDTLSGCDLRLSLAQQVRHGLRYGACAADDKFIEEHVADCTLPAGSNGACAVCNSMPKSCRMCCKPCIAQDCRQYPFSCSDRVKACPHILYPTVPITAYLQIKYCSKHSSSSHPMWFASAGREVIRMYGRLRGVPSQHLEAMVDRLLLRLGLGQYADRVCDSYSGGNKRKLSVAIALVGDPPAVLMDEPSTGMDPGAKRFLWDLIQKQVVDAGVSLPPLLVY